MASNTLEIIIKASTGQAERSLKSLDKTVDKIGKTTGSRFDTIKNKFSEMDARMRTPEGMKAMIGVAGAVVGALVSVGLATKKLADDYMNYAFQVKDFGRIIGATPEEASKLIQVADDVRLSVESMTTAMRSAITKGYAPTIEGLGKLSNEYLAIQDPIERSRFLIEKFGRSGLEMAKLMELGSSKITEMGKSVEGTARLMTKEGIKAADEYYTALDNLGDAAEDLELSFGQVAAEGITAAANALMSFTEESIGAIKSLKTIAGALEASDSGWMRYALAVWNVLTIQYKLGASIRELIYKGLGKLAGSVEEVDGATEDYIPTIDAVTRAYEHAIPAMAYYASQSMIVAEAIEDIGENINKAAVSTYNSAGAIQKAINDIDAREVLVSVGFDFQMPDITSELANLVQAKKWEEAGGLAIQNFYAGIKAGIANLTLPDITAISKELSVLELATKVEIGEISIQDATKQIQDAFGGTYGEVRAEIKAAIAIDPTSEVDVRNYLTNELITEPIALGLEPFVDYDVLAAAILPIKDPVEIPSIPKLDETVYSEIVNKITTPLVIPVTIQYNAGGQTTPGGIGDIERQIGRDLNGNGIIGKATGGTVTPGQWYMVGERGPELFQPNQAGSIIPNNRLGGSTTITNYFSVVAATALDIRDLARQVAREQQRAGAK